MTISNFQPVWVVATKTEQVWVKGKGVEGQDPRLTRKERPTMTGVYIVNIKYLSKVNFTSKFETLFKRT